MRPQPWREDRIFKGFFAAFILVCCLIGFVILMEVMMVLGFANEAPSYDAIGAGQTKCVDGYKIYERSSYEGVITVIQMAGEDGRPLKCQ